MWSVLISKLIEKHINLFVKTVLRNAAIRIYNLSWENSIFRVILKDGYPVPHAATLA